MENKGREYQITKILKDIRTQMQRALIEEFKGMNVTASQGLLIKLLIKEESMKVSEISNAMGLSNSTVSGIIDRLEKKDVVVRERSRLDRRVVNIKLSEKISNKFKEKTETEDDFLDKMLGNATEEELQRVLDGFLILGEIMNRK